MRIKHMMILSALCLSMMATSCSSHSTETAPETTKKEVAIQLYSVRDLVKDGSNLDQILKDFVERGKHEELLEKNGYYKRLNDMQSLS